MELGLPEAMCELSHGATSHGRDALGEREREGIEMRREEGDWERDERDRCVGGESRERDAWKERAERGKREMRGGRELREMLPEEGETRERWGTGMLHEKKKEKVNNMDEILMGVEMQEFMPC
jgi:hypothetical protein